MGTDPFPFPRVVELSVHINELVYRGQVLLQNSEEEAQSLPNVIPAERWSLSLAMGKSRR